MEANVVKKVDHDIQTLLNKYFWKIKFDTNLLLKDEDSFHMFYFSKKIPDLDLFIYKVLPLFWKLGYRELNSPDPRTYNYDFSFEWDEYLLIFHILSYTLEEDDHDHDGETMGIYMTYIKKL
jgi:hypothetical protein